MEEEEAVEMAERRKREAKEAKVKRQRRNRRWESGKGRFVTDDIFNGQWQFFFLTFNLDFDILHCCSDGKIAEAKGQQVRDGLDEEGETQL